MCLDIAIAGLSKELPLLCCLTLFTAFRYVLLLLTFFCGSARWFLLKRSHWSWDVDLSRKEVRRWLRFENFCYSCMNWWETPFDMTCFAFEKGFCVSSTAAQHHGPCNGMSYSFVTRWVFRQTFPFIWYIINIRVRVLFSISLLWRPKLQVVRRYLDSVYVIFSFHMSPQPHSSHNVQEYYQRHILHVLYSLKRRYGVLFVSWSRVGDDAEFWGIRCFSKIRAVGKKYSSGGCPRYYDARSGFFVHETFTCM